MFYIYIYIYILEESRENLCAISRNLGIGWKPRIACVLLPACGARLPEFIVSFVCEYDISLRTCQMSPIAKYTTNNPKEPLLQLHDDLNLSKSHYENGEANEEG